MVRGAALLLGIALFVATDSAAQTLVGSVLEEGRNTPVAGATISLVDQDGEHRAYAISDSLGHFQLAPPEPGEYVVEAAALGYEPANSPLFAMTLEGSVPFEFVLRPSPIGLEGLDVSVEPIDVVAERLLRQYGQSPASLGRRWIDRAALSSLAMSGDPGVAIQWLGVPRVWVMEGAKHGRNPRLCVQDLRTRACAIIILNGVKIDPAAALAIDFHQLEAIAVLTPSDATTFFGTGAIGGAVLLWIREDGR